MIERTEDNMIELSICIGSSCHIKGSYKVIKRLEELIEEHLLSETVTLKASFCLGHCTDGVSVMIGDRLINNVSPENVDAFFKSCILESD